MILAHVGDGDNGNIAVDDITLTFGECTDVTTVSDDDAVTTASEGNDAVTTASDDDDVAAMAANHGRRSRGGGGSPCTEVNESIYNEYTERMIPITQGNMETSLQLQNNYYFDISMNIRWHFNETSDTCQ